MVKMASIEVGQLFKEAGRATTLRWEVEAVFTGVDGRQYARMRRTDDRSAQKTLALSALGDRDRYLIAAR